MGRRVARLAAGLALVAVCTCTPAAERAEQARQAVESALAKGDREAALEAVAELRSALPATPDALLELGTLLVESGSAPDAAWLLEEGVARHPDRDDLRIALAQVALLLGNPSLAREAVAPIAPGSEQHAAALIARARAELGLGDLAQALGTLEEAERLHPEKPEVRLVRIATLIAERRQAEAQAAIAEARAALGGEAEATLALRRLDVMLAQIQAQQGEAQAALERLDRMLQEDPQDLLAWGALVEILVQQERSEEALARLEAALAVDEPSRELQPLLARVHVALGHDAEAEAALRSFAASSESATAYLPLVELLSKRDDSEAVTSTLDEAIARFPRESNLRRLRTEALLGQGRIDEARAELARFREATFDGDPQLDYLLARLELAGGEARAAAEQLAELAPRLDRSATQFWLGRALEELGDTEGARRRYGLAIQRDPGWAAPASAIVAVERRRGDWRAMAEAARMLVQRAPRRLEGWVALADALAQLGEGKAAEEFARQALERFPDRKEPRVLLARAFRAQHRYAEALATLDAEEGRSGGEEPLVAERVLTLGIAGRVDEGIALAREALAREPGSAELHSALASVLYAAGAAREGSSATDQALALAPDEPRPLRVRCEFRASTGDWAGARTDCTRYLEARPDDPGAHFILGVALEGLGERQTAAAAYRRAAALDERDSRARNNLAELLAAEGDIDAALAAAQEAYRLDGSNPYVLDTLGALYLRKGHADRAASLLQEAHTAAPALPETTLRLAMAYARTGRAEQARALLEGLRQGEAGADPRLRARVDEELRSLP